MSATEVKGRKAQNEMWERHRSTIQDLYLHNNLTKLMEVMASEYDFVRSRAQYESIFSKWNLRKNHKASEWKAVGHRITKRVAQGKKSEILAPGMSKEKVQRAISRYSYQTTLERVQAPHNALSPKSPTDIQISTPPADSWLSNITINLPWVRLSRLIDSLGNIIEERNFATQNLIFRAENYTPSQDYLHAGSLIPEIPSYRSTMDLIEPRVGSRGSTSDLEYLKLACYLLSNNLGPVALHKGFRRKIVELCESKSNIAFLKQLLDSEPVSMSIVLEKILSYAIDMEDESVVRSLINIEPHITDEILNSALIKAIYCGQSTLAFILVESGADINTIDEDSALCLSMTYNHFDIACFLIEKGADVNILTYAGKSALYLAINNGNPPATELLLERYAPFANGEDKDTCFGVAARTGNIQLVQTLLNHKRPIPGSHGPEELEFFSLPAACSSGNLEMVKFVISKGANAHINEEVNGQRAIQEAVESENLEIVKLLLGHGADPNTRVGRKLTPLQIASLAGDFDIVHLLLEHGAKVNAPLGESNHPIPKEFSTRIQVTGRFCFTALQASAWAGKIAVVEALLEAGASDEMWESDLANLVSKTKQPLYHEPKAYAALQLAALKGFTDISHLLIFYGANVNFLSKDGHTALTAATRSQELQMADTFLALGTNVNNPGKTDPAPSPLEIAVQFKGLPTVLRFLELGAEVDDPGALQAAARWDDPELFDVLLDRSLPLRVDNWNDYGKGALIVATIKGNTALVHRLVEAGQEPGYFEQADLNIPMDWKMVDVYYMFSDGFTFCSMTALAVYSMDAELVRFFLDRGASIPGREQQGEVPILSNLRFEAENSVEIMRLLLDADAIVDDCYYNVGTHKIYKGTLLQLAASANNFKLVKYLLSVGTNINSQAHNLQGRTALQAAAENNNLEMVKFLISENADVNGAPARERGATALQFAAGHGNFEMAVLLLDAGADINAPRGEIRGRTALEQAAELGRLDMVHFLLEGGAQIDGAYEEQYRRAVLLARKRGHFGLAKMIEAYKKEKMPGVEWRVESIVGWDPDHVSESESESDSELDDRLDLTEVPQPSFDLQLDFDLQPSFDQGFEDTFAFGHYIWENWITSTSSDLEVAPAATFSTINN